MTVEFALPESAVRLQGFASRYHFNRENIHEMFFAVNIAFVAGGALATPPTLKGSIRITPTKASRWDHRADVGSGSGKLPCSSGTVTATRSAFREMRRTSTPPALISGMEKLKENARSRDSSTSPKFLRDLQGDGELNKRYPQRSRRLIHRCMAVPGH